MSLSPSISRPSYGLPGGGWRWLALGFVFITLIAGGLAVGAPEFSRWAGFVLLVGLGSVALIFLVGVWPRTGDRLADAQRLATAAAQAHIAWAITGKDGAVLDCNNAYRKLAGISEHEIPPPPELALASDPSSSVLYRLARGAIDGEPREETLKLDNGLELSAAVRPLGRGEAAWWFMPRLSAEPVVIEKPMPAPAPAAAPIAAPALFRDAPVGVALADENGKIFEANRAFADFFDLPGAGTSRILGDLIETADKQALADLLSKGGAASTGPIELRAGGRTDRTADIYASPFAAGDIRFVLLYLIDVSEQKALELKFAQSQKMQAVGQLAGGVAHDFNNLLTVIIGNSEFLLMRHQAGDPSFKEINEIHQNALRAAQLVGQLLAFSRKQTLQPRVLALADVVTELSHMLRRLLREGIDLKVENQSDLWPVNADETQLSNAIINMVVNARDAMPKGGSVTITTSNEITAEPQALGTAVMPPGEYVRIEVADTGTGMDKETMAKIFDPFFTTKAVGQGTGLGLATVYGIVKQSGGFITVDSEPGKGTAFRIYLPRHYVDTTAPAIEEPQQTAARDVTGQDTILLVEDEEAVRSFAARALRMRGYNVLEADGGEEALAIMEKQAGEIALVISDVVMPNMDGPTLVRAVRRLRPDMKVMFMSGYAEEAFRRNEEKAEDFHFLPKPFGLKQLAAKVKEVLSGTPPPAAR
ncbi:MAG TPA: ATP-binding protein [Rhizomicrobium sp.]|nr:ATP-binding protein [Rhizomicrobium sp.]